MTVTTGVGVDVTVVVYLLVFITVQHITVEFYIDCTKIVTALSCIVVGVRVYKHRLLGSLDVKVILRFHRHTCTYC